MKTVDKSEEMGQVCWKWKGKVWEVRHLQDQEVAVGQLRSLVNLNELEELVRWDGQGQYRPLRTEGNLAVGWRYSASSEWELREALEVIYPGMWGNAEAWKNGKLKFQTWDDSLAKQTERVRKKATETGGLPRKVIETNCKRRCLKAVLWAGERPIDQAKTVPMLCTGPCGMFWSSLEG
jgi:hypothetical protein